MKKLIVVAMVLALVGCASVPLTPTNEDNLRNAVHLATAIMLDSNPQRAPQIAIVANTVKAVIASGNLLTVADLDAYIQNSLDLSNMSFTEQVLIRDYLSGILKSGLNYFSLDKVTAPNLQLAELSKAMDWVLEIASQPVARMKKP